MKGTTPNHIKLRIPCPPPTHTHYYNIALHHNYNSFKNESYNLKENCLHLFYFFIVISSIIVSISYLRDLHQLDLPDYLDNLSKADLHLTLGLYFICLHILELSCILTYKICN